MRIFSELLARVRSLLDRDREAREFAEEIRFHIERETEKNIAAGMRRTDARRAAHVAFGGVEQWTERWREARGVGFVERSARDVRLAMRRFMREPSLAVPALLTVALGVGASTAVFALVHSILLAPLPYPEGKRLVDVGHLTPAAGLERLGLSPGTYHHYRADARAFDDLAHYYENAVGVSVTDGDAPERVRVAMVSPSFFPVLGVAPAAGRWFAPEEGLEGSEPGPVVISHDLWVRRYGATPAIVGRSIELNQRPRTVVGVTPPGFAFPHPDTDVWYADPSIPSTGDLPRDLLLSGVARLRPGVQVAAAEAELERLLGALTASPELRSAGVRPSVTPLRALLVEDVRRPLLLLALTSGIVLLATLANVAGLFLVRAEQRARELEVAKALGAGRADLIRRFVLEGLLLAAAGGAVGAALARGGVAVRFGLPAGELPRLHELELGAAGLSFAVLLSVSVALVIMAVSLLRTRGLSSGRGALASSGRSLGGRGWRRLHRGLASLQVALSLALLVASAVMAESLLRLSRVDPGFEPAGTLSFRVNPPASRYEDYATNAALHRELHERLQALPGVTDVALVGWLPLDGTPDFARDHVEAVGEPAATDVPPAWLNLASPGYFELMGIPLLSGSAFADPATPSDAPPVVLSARLAKLLFGEQDPVGRRIHFPGYARFIDLPEYTVAGVVGDVPGESLAQAFSPSLYFPAVLDAGAPPEVTGAYLLVPREAAVVLRTDGAPADLVSMVRAVVRSLDPKLPVTEVRTLGDLVDDATARRRLITLLLAVAAAACVGLGGIGAYGIVSYAVSQRTAEIGLRLSLGATPWQVERMVLGQIRSVAVAGVAAGSILAYALTRALTSQLYEVGATEPHAYLGMATLLLTVVFLAGWLPARRAGSLDPVEALRAE